MTITDTKEDFYERNSRLNADQRRSRIATQAPYNGLGKLPPQATDLEEAVLGAIMIERDAFLNISEFLTQACFYKDTHQKIFAAIENLFKQGSPIDILTVTAQLRQQGELEMIGGAYYITNLTDRVATAANIEFHARIIYQKYLQREMIRISTDVIQSAYEDTTDVLDLLEYNQMELFNLTSFNTSQKSEKIGNLIDDELADQDMPAVGNLTGVGSGLTALDNFNAGWQSGELTIIAARPAMGKCFGLGTKIIMFDGTIKNVEEIKVGDQLMGPDSKPRNILSLATGFEQMYWIRQNKGIDYRVNESHILSLKRSGTQGQTKHGDVLNIPLMQYLNQSKKFQIRNKGYKVKVEFDKKEVEIEPYFLGIWLGDGSPCNQTISNPDKEIIKYMENLAVKYEMRFSSHTAKDKCPNLSIVKISGKNNKLMDILRTIDVLNNKHIPHNFLINNRENRLELLAGLIDTDGFYDKNFNVVEIIQVRERLARQIKYLCHTLGFACTIKEVTKGIKSRNFTGQYFRLIISGDLHVIPTKIKRKQASLSKNKRNVLVTGIKVEKDIVDKYYGFTIDGDSLFLLEDCTVTHNTTLMMQLARNAAVMFDKPVMVFSLEMTKKQLTKRMISNETEVFLEKFNKKTLTPFDRQSLDGKLHKLRTAEIHVDDTAALSVVSFRSKCIRAKKLFDIQLIMIDYLQLMTGDANKKNGNRDQELGVITRALKAVAKELNVPVIALSQLSRATENRPGGINRPQLKDLRESGNIEQDADNVYFLYRPEYYGLTTDSDGNSTQQMAELINAKHRNGPCETLYFKFRGAVMRFENWVNPVAVQSLIPLEPTILKPVSDPDEELPF